MSVTPAPDRRCPPPHPLDSVAVAHILITNDDGVFSPGLRALVAPLQELGTVHIVAPHTNRSAIGRALTIHAPLTIEEVTLDDGTPARSCDGTPVDCVRIAALGLVGVVPDVVVSGINLGMNMGDDVTYSGTVGAALEGLACGMLGIGVSQEYVGPQEQRWDADRYEFGPVARFTAELVAAGLRGELPPGCAFNVNCPSRPAHDPPQVRATRLGRRIYNDELLPHDADGDALCYSIYNERPSHHEEIGTDFAAHLEGAISVSPIHLRLTDDDAVAPLGAVLERR